MSIDPLPPNARCVFKNDASPTEVWQWEQELYDGSKKIFEKIKRPDSVEIVAATADPDATGVGAGKIIILEQEQPLREPFISVPGGGADNGDDHLTEAKRELLEETGYVSDDWELWFSYVPSSRHIYTVYHFIARDCKKAQEPDAGPGEKVAVRLVSFDEFLAFSDDPKFRGLELTNKLLRMRLHPEEREAFRKMLFR